MKPLAQTFSVSTSAYPNGLFLTSVDLFFAARPTGEGAWPVSVEVRGVENQIPTGVSMEGSQVYVNAEDVNVPAEVDRYTLSAIQSTPTNFKFDEPIYLRAGYMYAIVVKCNTSEYSMYHSKVYEYQIGTDERRISKQPYLGALYLTQNGTVWNPDFGSDLMIRLNRASFDDNSIFSAVLENGRTGDKLLGDNPLQMYSGDSDVKVLHTNHGFNVDDYVRIRDGVDSATVYNGIQGESLLGYRQITAVDWSGYTFKADSEATSTLRTGGSDVIVPNQHMMDEMSARVSYLKPVGTYVTAYMKNMSGASYATDRNKVTNSAYAKEASFKSIVLNDYIINDYPKLIASKYNEEQNLWPLQGGTPTNSSTLRIDLSTLDSAVSPVIDLQRAAIYSLQNMIDKQSNSLTSGYNIPIEYVAETDPSDGSSAAKHISQAITLNSEAVGLKIILAANRPSPCDFLVYYRTATSDQVITDQAWTLVDQENDIPADNDPTVYREYEYLAGGLGGDLPPFTTFQTKIVMRSTNSAKYPKIKDLRAIALAV